MSYWTPMPASPETGERRSRRLPFWAIVLFYLSLSCVIVSVLSALLLNHLSTALDTTVPTVTLPPAPTTPATDGLSGQASCRRLAPSTTSPWLAVARDDAGTYGLDTLAFEWQIWQESKFNPNAVSATGAIGIAQFEPSTAAALGIDPTNPRQSLDAAAHLDLERLSDYAQRGTDLADHYGGASSHYAYGFVLAAYNAGTNAVETAWNTTFTSAAGPIWPSDAWDWLSLMPSQTRGYVPAILGCL